MNSQTSNTIDDATLLLQERIVLFLRILVGIHLFLMGSFLLVVFVVGSKNVPNFYVMALNVVIPMVGIYGVRRSKSVGFLATLEAVVTLGYVGFYLNRAIVIQHVPSPFMGLVLCMMLLSLRASVVPSPPGRTVVIGGLCVAAFGIVVKKFAPAPTDEFLLMMMLACAFVSITVATSHIIYGLQSKVRRVEKLGQYQIEGVLGAGGMGTVYMASHAMLQRPTALKVLGENSSQVAIDRFRDEVRITSRLTHPNTINIFDYGVTPAGLFYYAMEYLPGSTLRDVVGKTGPMPSARAIDILVQICGSIQEAHHVGVLHRDIKPSNVMLCERGGEYDSAIVLDFGLVAHFGDDNPDILVGTPTYMAPETILESNAGEPRSDLYAIGALGYFLLCGRPPFRSDDVIELLCQQLEDDPIPPSELAPFDVHPELERILLQCLSKAPEDRPKSAAEMKSLLQAIDLNWSLKEKSSWWAAFGELLEREAVNEQQVPRPKSFLRRLR